MDNKERCIELHVQTQPVSHYVVHVVQMGEKEARELGQLGLITIMN